MTKLPTSSKIKRVVVTTLTGRIHILFGADPLHKNPFEAAAWYLHKRLKRAYKNSKVQVEDPKNISSSPKLMALLLDTVTKDEDKIRQLHVFSHAWSTGLSLNYGGTPTNQDLKDLEKLYGPLVKQHIGSDDYDKFNAIQLRISNFQYLSEDQIKKLRARFADKAIVRLWGCNSGYTGAGTTGPYANISKTIGLYANVMAYGAPKGTNFYAFINKKWTTEHPPVANKAPWPFELRPYRYQGSKQSNAFKPTLTLAQLIKKKLKAKTPYLQYLDENLNKIKPQPTNKELYIIKSGTLFMVVLADFEDTEQAVTLYKNNGAQIQFDALMTISPHSEWKISSDKKTVTLKQGRSEFTGVLHQLSTLSANGLANEELFFKIAYTSTAGTKTFEGKKYRLAIF